MTGTVKLTEAQRDLKRGANYPYDAPDDWGGPSDRPPPEALDWAHSAARGVIADLVDRRHIKWAFEGIDEAVRVEIVSSLANIIREAGRAALASKETTR